MVPNGKNLSGLWLDDAYAGHPNKQVMLDVYARVVETRQPAWRRNAPYVVPAHGCHIVEALRLPLASDGTAVDMVLGLVLYFDAAGRPYETMSHPNLGAFAAESVRPTGAPGSDLVAQLAGAQAPLRCD